MIDKEENFNPLVTVLIPVFNGEDYIESSINSVLRQSYKNIEILVIDDGSKDNTKKLCEKYKNKIKYLYKENGGVSTALNLGIKEAKGNYISWLSHDDLYKNNKIEEEIKALSKCKDKNTIVFSNFELIDSTGKVFNKTNYTSYYNVDEICKGIMPVILGMINGCTTLISKVCFEECGLFNEELKTVQDYDMWLRIFEKFPSLFLEDYLVQYRIHDKQGTFTYTDRFAKEDEFWVRVIKKMTPEYMKNLNQTPYEVVMFLYLKMHFANYKKAEQACWKLGKKYLEETRPIVTILIPCYNEEKFLEKAVKSLQKQSYQAFEIIIIDDYSTDETLTIANKLSKRDYRIKVIQNKNKKGLVGSLNTGLDIARGKYITRLDADDISIETRLENQILAFKKENIGYCSTNITSMDKNENTITCNLYKEPIAPIEFECAFGNPIPNATIMYNLDLIKKYNIRFKGEENYAEDYNFLLEYILITKTKGKFINESLYNYRLLKNSAYHKNSEKALGKSIKLAKEYIKTITNNELYNIDKFLFKNPPEVLSEEYLNEFLQTCKDLSIKFGEYFKWNEKEYNSIIDFFARKIYILHECSKVVNYNIKDSILKTIYRKIKWYYEEYGCIKFIYWIITIIPKKILKKLINKFKKKIEENKIKVLEVNNIDLAGKVFNGYDLIKDLNKKKFLISQIVINKQSNNKKVYKMLNSKQLSIFDKINEYESKQSVHNLFSITTPALFNSYSYYDTELIHFHMFHNTKLSIPSLIKISNEKKVIITLHDPWFLTGRCVHFYDCEKWKKGCNNCENIKSLFAFKDDNCNIMWNIKKKVFSKLDIDIVVTSEWMLNLVKNSPITKHIKNVHLIPFGINLKRFKNYNNSNSLKKKYNIDTNSFVIFLRAQTDFKGTEYVLEALKELKVDKKITILTCDQKGLLDELKSKYTIKDFGFTDEQKTIDLYNMCDLFLMPSKGESFGMMAVEAMACEKPVIVFDNTALPSITKAPECGYLVKNRDSKDLTKAIKYLINNDEERVRRGKLGRKICKELYSYDTYINKIEKLYKNVQTREHKYVENLEKKYSKKTFEMLKKNIKNYVLKNKFEKIDLSIFDGDEFMMLYDINDIIHDLIYEYKG